MFTVYDIDNEEYLKVEEPDPSISYTYADYLQWQFEETSEFKMHLNQLASGIYFIKCTNGSEVFNFKWIRE